MNEEKRISFCPPNITAFKKTELGDEGTLFKAQNENINTNNELMLVENRVRALKKEEDKMMRKINEARRKAD